MSVELPVLAWPFADGEGGRQGCELAWDLSFGFKPNTDAAPAAIDGKVKSGSGGTLWVAPKRLEGKNWALRLIPTRPGRSQRSDGGCDHRSPSADRKRKKAEVTRGDSASWLEKTRNWHAPRQDALSDRLYLPPGVPLSHPRPHAVGERSMSSGRGSPFFIPGAFYVVLGIVKTLRDR